jgi:hypothetical protein
VTEAPAPPSKKPPFGRRARDLIVEYPDATAIALYSLLAMAMAVAAYLAIFTQFASYDDEGTMLVTLKAFTHGDVLYRDIYTEYGPFYYELFGGFFSLTGSAVTNDASRSIVVVVWVSASLLFGLATQRLTGLLTLGVTGMLVAFATLGVLVNEPMHPQGLCVLLLGAFVLIVAREPGRRALLRAVVCGALIAALALTKINLGAFAIAAIALAAVLTLEPLQSRRWVRFPVVAAFLAMPVFVMGKELSQAWVRDLLAILFLATVAIVVAAWSVRPREGDDHGPLSRWMLGAVAGFVLAFVASAGAILLMGTTPASLYNGIIGEALRVQAVLVLAFTMPPPAVDWGIVAVAVAALVVWLRSSGSTAPTIWPGLLRAAAGLTIWFSVARIALFTVDPSAGNPEALPLALAWVAAIPPGGIVEAPYRRFLRVLLPALAVAEALQVYPVAGSQVGIAAIAFVPVGALCLADALTSLRTWSASRPAGSRERLGTVVAVATIALAGVFAYNSVLQPAATNAVAYRHQPKLPIAGASLLHLPAPDVETYSALNDLIRSHRCTTFIGYPSLNSLYLWSSIEAPLPTAPGAWADSLNRSRQQRIVDQMRSSPRPCVVRSDSRAQMWLQGAPPPDRPLVNYVLNDFHAVAQVGEYEFSLPNGRASELRLP